MMKYAPIRMNAIPTARELKLLVFFLMTGRKVKSSINAAVNIVKVELSRPNTKTGLARSIGSAYRLKRKCLTQREKTKLVTAMAPHLNNLVLSTFGRRILAYNRTKVEKTMIV